MEGMGGMMAMAEDPFVSLEQQMRVATNSAAGGERVLTLLHGPEAPWVRACRYAATASAGVAWLAPHVDADRPSWLLQQIAAAVGDRAAARARALAAATLAAHHLGPYLASQEGVAPVALRDACQALWRAAAQWQAEVLEDRLAAIDDPEAATVLEAALDWPHSPTRRVAALLARLGELQPGWSLAPLCEVLLGAMGQAPEVVRAVSVRVLLVRPQQEVGVAATLRLALLRGEAGGRGELYPSPWGAGLLQTDGAFTGALARAWAYTRGRRPPEDVEGDPYDVRWELETLGPGLLEVGGTSIGAGCAVGLLHLLEPERGALDPGWAFTGDVTVRGRLVALGGYGGYAAKLAAAARAQPGGLTVVVPADDLARAQEEATRVQPGGGLELHGAQRVHEAAGLASERRRQVATYLEQVQQTLGILPDYFPTGFTFDGIRQHVSLSREPRRRPREEDPYQPGGREAFGRMQEQEAPVVQAWEELRGTVGRAVVLGDPGYGKTWLLRHEGQTLVWEAQAALAGGMVRVEEMRLPLYLRLTTLAQVLQEQRDARRDDVLGAVIEAARRDLAGMRETQANALAQELEAWLRARLRAGGVVLLLDALDEVPATTLAPGGLTALQAVREAVETVARETATPLRLTSRPAGYTPLDLRDQRQSPGQERNGTVKGQEYTLVAFDPAQVDAFVNAWFGDRPEQAARLRRELERPALRGMARIPLLLSFLCLLRGQSDRPLPTQRAALYADVLDAFLAKGWHAHRDSLPPLRTQAKLAVLAHLAWHLAQAGWRGALATRDIVAVLEDPALQAARQRLEQTQVVGGDLIEEVSTDDGVLVPVGGLGTSNVAYVFLHRTLQEYLVARYLTGRPAEEYLAAVGAHLWFDAAWRETLLLLAGVLADATPLLERVLAEPEDCFREMLLLAGECLAETAPGSVQVTVAGRIVADLGDLLTAPSDRTRTAAVTVLAAIEAPEVGTALRAAVHHGDKEVRRAAVDALGGRGDAAALAVLAEALRDPEAMVRWAAVEVLGRWGDDASLAVLAEALHDPEAQMRRTAVLVLGRRKDAVAVVAALAEALRDPEWSVRWAVVEALGARGDVASRAVLAEALRDQDAWVREATLEVALRNGHPWVREEAAWALGARGDAAALAVLREALRNSNAWVRQEAVVVLGWRDDDASLALLQEALHDPDRGVGKQAVGAMGWRGDAAALAALREALRDADAEVLRNPEAMVRWKVWDVSEALGEWGDAASPALLMEALRDPEAIVRREAVGALGRRGDAVALAVLAEALRDPEAMVRWAAVEALGRRGDAAALATLREALRDPDVSVRVAVAEALGERDDASLAALQEALRDPSWHVCEQAARALGGRGDAAAVAALVREAVVGLIYVQDSMLAHAVQAQPIVAMDVLVDWAGAEQHIEVTLGAIACYDALQAASAPLRWAAGGEWAAWRARLMPLTRLLTTNASQQMSRSPDPGPVSGLLARLLARVRHRYPR